MTPKTGDLEWCSMIDGNLPLLFALCLAMMLVPDDVIVISSNLHNRDTAQLQGPICHHWTRFAAFVFRISCPISTGTLVPGSWWRSGIYIRS